MLLFKPPVLMRSCFKQYTIGNRQVVIDVFLTFSSLLVFSSLKHILLISTCVCLWYLNLFTEERLSYKLLFLVPTSGACSTLRENQHL